MGKGGENIHSNSEAISLLEQIERDLTTGRYKGEKITERTSLNPSFVIHNLIQAVRAARTSLEKENDLEGQEDTLFMLAMIQMEIVSERYHPGGRLLGNQKAAQLLRKAMNQLAEKIPSLTRSSKHALLLYQSDLERIHRALNKKGGNSNGNRERRGN